MSAGVALDDLLSSRAVWRANPGHVPRTDGVPTGFPVLDDALPQGGWPQASLVELLLPVDGAGELALVLPTLARLTAAAMPVVLVAPPYVPYAPAWEAAGVDMRRVEIVEGDARHALWAFEQCLRSGACGAVLGWPTTRDGAVLRRLQVAADTGHCLGFAFRDRRHAANPSAAALRLEHTGDGWRVLKCRGGHAPQRTFALRAGH